MRTFPQYLAFGFPPPIQRVALARNLDFLAADDTSIPILTVHQSKGLEFDTIFIAGLTDDEFPSYYAKRDGKLEEEKRLFYVALTRAKRHLVMTSHEKNDWGRTKMPSISMTKQISNNSRATLAHQSSAVSQKI